MVGEMSLDSIQKMFDRIYGKRNAKLYSPADLLLHVFEETAVIAESFRKEDHSNVPKAIARFFGWLIGFCNSQGITLSKAVFDKYHGACPYCGKTTNCICISAETKPKAWHRNSGRKMPQFLFQWQTMFADIYGRVNRVAGMEKCWLHVHEELGEISQAFRLKQQKPLRDEIADVFAWIVAFCNRMKIDIGKAIVDEYPEKCDICGKDKCCCPKV